MILPLFNYQHRCIKRLDAGDIVCASWDGLRLKPGGELDLYFICFGNFRDDFCRNIKGIFTNTRFRYSFSPDHFSHRENAQRFEQFKSLYARQFARANLNDLQEYRGRLMWNSGTPNEFKSIVKVHSPKYFEYFKRLKNDNV